MAGASRRMTDMKCFDDLPDKIKLFVDEYMIDFDGKKAALRSGIENPGTAKEYAYKWVHHPVVVDEIGRRLAMRYAENEVTVNRVVEELADIGFVVLDRGEKVYKSQNKLKALELLGRHLGMFNDKLDVTVQKSFEEQLEEFMKTDAEQVEI